MKCFANVSIVGMVNQNGDPILSLATEISSELVQAGTPPLAASGSRGHALRQARTRSEKLQDGVKSSLNMFKFQHLPIRTMLGLFY